MSYITQDAFLLCFSVASPSSFENVRAKWFPEVKNYCPRVPIILVAMKTDLREDPTTLKDLAKRNLSPIDTPQGLLMAKQIGAVKYMECSALKLLGVTDIFQFAVRTAIDQTSLSKAKKTKSKSMQNDCCSLS